MTLTPNPKLDSDTADNRIWISVLCWHVGRLIRPMEEGNFAQNQLRKHGWSKGNEINLCSLITVIFH